MDGLNQPIRGIQWNPGGGTGLVQFGPGDELLLVMFYNRSVLNESRSLAENRPIHDNVIYVKIQHPGEQYNIIDRPASDHDKMRFRRHWELFLKKRAQIPEGVPIDFLFPNHPAVADTLRGYGVYTIEQCANLSAAAIDSIGRGAQEFVNRSKKYLESSEKGKGFQAQAEEIRKLQQTIRLQERNIKTMKATIDEYMARNNDPVRYSESPPFISGLDAQTERINATHVTQELKRKRQPKNIQAPDAITDPLAALEVAHSQLEGEDSVYNPTEGSD